MLPATITLLMMTSFAADNLEERPVSCPDSQLTFSLPEPVIVQAKEGWRGHHELIGPFVSFRSESVLVYSTVGALK